MEEYDDLLSLWVTEPIGTQARGHRLPLRLEAFLFGVGGVEIVEGAVHVLDYPILETHVMVSTDTGEGTEGLMYWCRPDKGPYHGEDDMVFESSGAGIVAKGAEEEGENTSGDCRMLIGVAL